VLDSIGTSVNGSYPLTNYSLSCTANIYYKTRCLDSPASYRLYYSSSQRNSACRQQRLNRINACLNSTVQLLDVPCLISVSSGRVTTTTQTCNQVFNANTLDVYLVAGDNNSAVPFTFGSTSAPLSVSYASETFSSSDENDGHAYRILSVNSENYPSTRKYSVD